MNRLIKLLLWWFLSLGSLYLAYRIGGAGSAVALIVHCIQPYLFPNEAKGTEEAFAAYKGIDWTKGDARNPLYLQGYFRKKCYDKNPKLFLAGVKGVCWHQVHTIIQLILFIFYGLYCLLIDGEHHWIIETVFMFWLLFSLGMIGSIADYYKGIIKKNLPPNYKKRKKWTPFYYEDYGERFKTIPKTFPHLYQEPKILESLFENIELRLDEEFAVRKKIGEKGWLRMYAKYDTDRQIKMYALIYFPELFEWNLDELNEIYQDVIEAFIVGDEIEKEWKFIFGIVVEKESDTFNNLLSHSIFQSEGVYRLPFGISVEKQCVYIPVQKDSFGIEKYNEMREDVLKLLE